MGLLNETQREYYQGDDHGGYQFTSLNDVINQFMVAYVGEGKIVGKTSKTDVAFHAMRAMQELSFDTFKSVKSQEIILPPSLTMILPHDYVNYTEVSWSDSSGIKHLLYPASKTSNPFSIAQDEDGTYEFSDDVELLYGNSFSSNQGRIHPRWKKTSLSRVQRFGQNSPPSGYLGFGGGYKLKSDITLKALRFTHVSQPINPINQLSHTGRVLSVWQKLDVTDLDTLKISGVVNLFDKTAGGGWSSAVPDGEVVIGIQTSPGQNNTKTDGNASQLSNPTYLSKNIKDPDLGFMLFNSGAGVDVAKELDVNVSNYNTVYFIINSRVRVTTAENDGTGVIGTTIPGQIKFDNVVKEVSAVNGLSTTILLDKDQQTEDSTTWGNYKSSSSTNTNYKDDYDFALGARYGIEPQYSQINGSFYIDNLKGLINFSSSAAGKTIILDYISDSLGTDEEMQVHKFAQQAVLMHIMYAVVSTKANIPEYVVRRFKKEKFAATRQAKLRLSNIKLEELTQILRGKSKWIKH